MRHVLLWVLAIGTLAGCVEEQRTGRWDGQWSGMSADGTFFSLRIEQSSKARSGDGIAGSGIVTWKSPDDGERTDELIVGGSGQMPDLYLELQRSIAHPSSVELGSVYFTGALSGDPFRVAGTLVGDDHDGMRFSSQQLVLTR